MTQKANIKVEFINQIRAFCSNKTIKRKKAKIDKGKEINQKYMNS